MRAYLLDDRIGSVEPMVEFLAGSFLSDVFTRPPDYVTYGKLVWSRTPIGVVPLGSSGLLLALHNGSPDFNLPVGTHPGIRHVCDGSISWNSLDVSL